MRIQRTYAMLLCCTAVLVGVHGSLADESASRSGYTRSSTVIVNESFFSRDRYLLTDVYLPNTEIFVDAPIVVYGHGFNSTPEENAELLGNLAAEGFKVYAPHSPGEGFNFRDRYDEDIIFAPLTIFTSK